MTNLTRRDLFKRVGVAAALSVVPAVVMAKPPSVGGNLYIPAEYADEAFRVIQSSRQIGKTNFQRAWMQYCSTRGSV